MFGANRSTSRGDPAQANHRRSARAPLLEAPLRTRYRHGLIASRRAANTLTHGFPLVSISKWHHRLLSGAALRASERSLTSKNAAGKTTRRIGQK